MSSAHPARCLKSRIFELGEGGASCEVRQRALTVPPWLFKQVVAGSQCYTGGAVRSSR